ncbi:MAG: hypothetical protein R3336_04410, partial [Phycisphaeraceae bacterium]|nr:hypothetical protein [Phycisphaeraceae bacterium]
MASEESIDRKALERAQRADCRWVASALQMPGQGPVRQCPACRTGFTQSEYTLALSVNEYNCFNCGTNGGPVTLVRLVRGKGTEDAVQWLNEHMHSVQARGSDTMVFDSPGIYEHLLERCLPVKGPYLKVLQQAGVSEATVEAAGLRVGPPVIGTVIRDLIREFGRVAVAGAGLLEREPENAKDDDPFHSIFDVYEGADVSYLLFPFIYRGKPVFITAHPLVSGTRRKELGLPSGVQTGPEPPFFYNIEEIGLAERVVLVRRELDALAIMSEGYPAIAAVSWSNLGTRWVSRLKDRKIVVISDRKFEKKPRQQLKFLLEVNTHHKPVLLLWPKNHSLVDMLKHPEVEPHLVAW